MNSKSPSFDKVESRISKLIAIALSSALAFSPAVANDAQQAVPDKLPQWSLVCDVNKRCEMSIVIADEKGPISHLLIYDVGQKRLLEYLVPLRVNLQKGVKLLIDRKQQFETTALYCDAPGCIGYTQLDERLLKALRAGQMLELVFQGVNERQAYALPYRLKGFSTTEQEFSARATSQKRLSRQQ